MRTPVLLSAALVLAACGSDRRTPSAEPGASSKSNRGPDAILLRVPRAGGRVAAYAYPNLDSAVWRSGESAPALDRVLAFDGESGLVAAVDARGLPTRLDLRLGTVRKANDVPLSALASANGVDIFGVAANGAVTRLTPSGGEWAVQFPAPIQSLQPQRDGTLLVAAKRGSSGVVWRLRPPGTRVADSVVVGNAGRVVSAQTADRVYFASGSELAGVQGRTLTPLKSISLDGPVRAIVATPSGDRFYAALDGESTLSVIDRYSNAVAATVTLPGSPSDLRVDPLGRYVLARAADGDSAWVVTVGNDQVLGAVHTAWRADLPLVLPDGAILAAVGRDAIVVDGRTLVARHTIAGGAADFWHLLMWNGFRPRAAGLDQPVEFKSNEPAVDSAAADSTARIDSTAPKPDSTRPQPTPPDTARSRPSIQTAEAAVPSKRGFTVQFAAAGTEREARVVLRQLKLAGDVLPRIVPKTVNSKTMYCVVAGPFATRIQAERVGKSSGRGYWLYEGAP